MCAGSAGSAQEPAGLPEIVRQSLRQIGEPPQELMLAEHASAEVLAQMRGKRGRAVSPHLRLLRWIGDPSAIPALLQLADDPEIDRYQWVRTLVALDAPQAQRFARELFQSEPAFGAPLVRHYPQEATIRQALRMLSGDQPQHWRYAAWVLGSSRDYNHLGALQAKLDQLGKTDLSQIPAARTADRALRIAARRLLIEQRDVRQEALLEYLEEVAGASEDERFWCLAELARCGNRQTLEVLQKSPWKERAAKQGEEPALLLWTRFRLGEEFSAPALHQLRIQRYHLDWIPGGTRWPPRRQAD